MLKHMTTIKLKTNVIAFLSISILSCLMSLPAMSASKGGSLTQCKAVKDKIDHYINLRRAGGSAKEMNNWIKKRNHFRKKYFDLGCDEYKKDLK